MLACMHAQTLAVPSPTQLRPSNDGHEGIGKTAECHEVAVKGLQGCPHGCCGGSWCLFVDGLKLSDRPPAAHPLARPTA